jgi:hypothetical protein
VLFAYFAPETVLPLTSLAAGVAGVILVFGRNSVRLVIGLLASARRLGRAARHKSL